MGFFSWCLTLYFGKVSVGDLFNIVLGFALALIILENIIKHAAAAGRIKKQRRRGRESSDEVPLDIMEGILSRLPVKSLLRLKGVCRQWLLLIKDPKFIKLHQRSTQTLVTVVHNQLWCTKEHMILPPFPENYASPLIGFGYDPINDDYKVVRFYNCWTSWGHHDHLAIFYSLRLNSWERKHGNYNIFRECVVTFSPGVYLDGALNWRARHKSEVDIIICLDFDTEKARTLRLPYYEPNDGFWVSSLDVFEGNLCVGYKNDDLMMTDIWVMKEYGNDESWTKMFSIRGEPSSKVPLTCIHGDQVLLLSTEGIDAANLVYYNLKKKKIEKKVDLFVCIPELVFAFPRQELMICHESLVPINSAAFFC
ncbi:hypothetical protein COLO4_14886 [Corchorus olitorius]|uniref:F-box domain-containing protein n=1 Tax=Corchorus olitorius TaxID=93759 RepID=A0A1R3JQC9_9ROSI|nr:hypothetical protein COLO4_14886 [Corchorus olitorius]